MRLRRTLLGLCFVAAFIVPVKTMVEGQSASEAPAGFDNQTNGFTTQAVFDANKEEFEQRETAEDGLGPVYNAQSCAECHANPVAGAASQVSAFRAGHFNGSQFVDHPGGSLIANRAIDAASVVLPQAIWVTHLGRGCPGNGWQGKKGVPSARLLLGV